ncbi:MAG TPA: YdjY domain-containing protein [Chthoniobacteraceae bacterium]|nr:YdjY domain-containing protein [Chthoniobacteraceae bacterium]
MNQLLPVCFPTVSFFFAAFMMVAGHSLAQKELDTGTFVPAMEEISPGVFKIGKIRLDKTKRSVTFPGKLNMAKDLIEYVLVTPDGSTHESLLTAEIQPTDLQFVMLLLDAKGAGLLAPQPDAAPPGQINAEYLKTAPRLKGDNISIAVAWKTQDGSEKIVPLEDLLMHEETKKPAPRGPWLYNGSMFGADGKFLAQQQGCFISVVTNPAALINNPRKGSDNDRIWAVNEKQSPPVGTAVEISITLLPGSSETK